MLSSLHIRLLGGFHLQAADQTVDALGTPRLQALLTCLLLHRTAPVARQQLAFLFWPESTEAAARTNLRSLLLQLRRALPGAERWFALEPPVLQCRPDAPITVDVTQFEEAVARAAQATDDRARRCALEEAIALYAGDLLPACYDEWIQPHRERLREMYLDTMERLAIAVEQDGDLPAAISVMRRLLRQEPLRELSYRQLMRLQALNGERAAALQTYQTCAMVLRQVLGVAPSEVTTALYARLVHDEYNLRASTPAPLLPSAATRFVGREHELSALGCWLADPACRLITLTGLGGIGKTRLALETGHAHRSVFADGVWFVPLAPVSSAGFLVTAIATALHISLAGPAAPDVQLLNVLREKEMLVILDNFEHLLEGAVFLATLLEQAPRVRSLVTSRERLHLRHERVLLLEGLPLPAEDTRPQGHGSAVELFLQAACQLQPGFAPTASDLRAIRQICQLLDGLPLGIELTASWVRILPCTAIAEESERTLDFVVAPTRDMPERHHSLRAVFEHSWRRLDADEQRVLRALAVFHGGFDRATATEVAGATLPLLASLVDRSLVCRMPDERYGLHEMVRQYAGEQLVRAGEVDATRDRLVRHELTLVETAAPLLLGSERPVWLKRLSADYDTIRVALAWSQGSTREADAALRLAGALTWYWYFQGYFAEGCDWLDAALAAADERVDSPARARALWGAGFLQWAQGHLVAAASACAAALRVAEVSDDVPDQAWASLWLGVVCWWQGDRTAARVLFDRSILSFRAVNDSWGVAFALRLRGDREIEVDDLAVRQNHLQESLQRFRLLGDPWGEAYSLEGLGHHADLQGDYASARALFSESLELRRRTGDRWFMAWSLRNLGDLEGRAGATGRAIALLHESLVLFQQLGTTQRVVRALYYRLGGLARCAHDEAGAVVLFREGFASSQEHADVQHAALCLAGLAGIALSRGHVSDAARVLAAADALLATIIPSVPASESLEIARDIAKARAQLGMPAFGAAWAQGQSMGLEQARACVLALLSAQAPGPVLARERGGSDASSGVYPAGLTERETHVLRYVAAGCTSARIAAELSISRHTVTTHLRAIYRKLGVSSRSAATRFALEHHLA